MEQWERDDLIRNLTAAPVQCDRAVQERMVWHFLLAENDIGRRIGEGLGIGAGDVADLEPLASQDLTDEDRQRLANLGENPPRDVEGLTMTHCVPDDRHVVTRYGPRRLDGPPAGAGGPSCGEATVIGGRTHRCPAFAARPPAGETYR